MSDDDKSTIVLELNWFPQKHEPPPEPEPCMYLIHPDERHLLDLSELEVHPVQNEWMSHIYKGKPLLCSRSVPRGGPHAASVAAFDKEAIECGEITASLLVKPTEARE